MPDKTLQAMTSMSVLIGHKSELVNIFTYRLTRNPRNNAETTL